MSFLILLLGRIGDMILLTPVIKILSEYFPDAHIDVIASKHNWVILENNPRISNLFVYDKNPLHTLRLIAKLRSSKYSYYIDPKDHKSTESQIFAKIIRANYKIYFVKNTKKQNIFPIKEIDKFSGMHFSQKMMQPLQFLNINLPDKPILPEIWEDKDSQIFISNFFEKLPENKINVLLNISASNPKKMWEVDKWAKFLNSIGLQKFNIIISADPKDRDLIKIIHNTVPETIITPARNFKDLISLIKKSDIIITPDTSIVHIASAFNKPILALYSGLSWSHTLFGPLSDLSMMVSASDGIDDIRTINVDEVIKSFNELLRFYSIG